jgi:hypothetical protein
MGKAPLIPSGRVWRFILGFIHQLFGAGVVFGYECSARGWELGEQSRRMDARAANLIGWGDACWSGNGDGPLAGGALVGVSVQVRSVVPPRPARRAV